jgi:hypothetical protein
MKRVALLPILLAAGLLMQPAPVSAAPDDACYNRCVEFHSCYGANAPGGLAQCLHMCWDICKSDSWGAIAYSWTDKIAGWSYAQDDKATAQRIAMQYCAKEGGAKCILQTSFNNLCSAVAADRDLVAWGTSDTKSKAYLRAMAECEKIGGKKCAVEVSVCSAPNNVSGGTPEPPKAISWGAIAYSSGDMGAGWSQGKADRASAEREAMNACSQHGKACVLRNAFNKACGALAADRDITGLGTSANPRDAQQQAITECQKAGGTRCALHVAFCSM